MSSFGKFFVMVYKGRFCLKFIPNVAMENWICKSLFMKVMSKCMPGFV